MGLRTLALLAGPLGLAHCPSCGAGRRAVLARPRIKGVVHRIAQQMRRCPQHQQTAVIDQTDDYDTALRYGIYTRRILPAVVLAIVHRRAGDILIAYGQSKSVVNFMVRGLDPLPSPGELESRRT